MADGSGTKGCGKAIEDGEAPYKCNYRDKIVLGFRRPRFSRQVMMILQDGDIRSSRWIVDLGANVFLVNKKRWFTDFRSFSYPIGTARNDSKFLIKGEGTINLSLAVKGEPLVTLELHNVTYALSARCNIISMSVLTEKGNCFGIWDNTGIKIISKDGHQIGIAPLIDGLFHLQVDD